LADALIVDLALRRFLLLLKANLLSMRILEAMAMEMDRD
jgi:hypothetical protein